MADLEIEADGQWFALVSVTAEIDGPASIEWRTACRVCKQPFTFHTGDNIPEGKLRRCCDKHTSPNLRLVHGKS